MAKDYTVDIGHHLKSKKETKPNKKQKSKKDISNTLDREIEGTIDMDNDDWLFDKNY